MTITEKVAYLKGLMEGLEFDTDSKEGKIISYMADILEDMAAELADTQDDIDDINEYLEAVDEDLTNVEEELFGDLMDEEDDCCCCDGCDEEEDCFEVLCPHCKEVICLEEAPEGDSITCPVCAKEIPLD
jgi:hypothetical protein